MKCQHVDFTWSNRYFELKQAPEAEGCRKDKEDKGERRDRADQATRANSCKTLSH